MKRIKLVTLPGLALAAALGFSSGVVDVASAPTADAAVAVVKSPTRGLHDRKGFPNSSFLRPVHNFVVEARWADVQPHGPSELVTTKIDAEIATARAAGMQVKLRVFAGKDTPTWVRQRSGSFTLEGHNGVGTISVPRWWTTDYIAAYDALQARLAARYDGNPTVRENYLCGPTIQYCEPYLRLTRLDSNRPKILAAGLTTAKDEAALRANISAGRHWRTTPVTIAFNPYQPVGAAFTHDVAFTIRHMTEFRTKLGCRAVLANHSLASHRNAGDYGKMYAAQTRLGAPIAYQTGTMSEIGDWRGALELAVDLGASSVELPSPGYVNWPASELQAFASRLAQNATCR